MINISIEEELECEDELLLIAGLMFNEGQAEWARMLWQLGDEVEFLEVCKKSPSPQLAIMAYRRQLHNSNSIVVKEEDLCKAFDENDSEELHSLLQLLFLEIIAQHDYEHTIKYIDGKSENLQKLYKKHISNKREKLRRVIMELTFQHKD